MAINGLFEGVQTKGGRKCFVDFRVQGNGASSPTTIVGGGVTSVARTGTGAYTITLDETYTRLDRISIQFQDTNYGSSAKRVNVIVIAHDVTSAKTITIQVEDGTDGQSNAAINLATTQWLHVSLCLVNGSAS